MPPGPRETKRRMNRRGGKRSVSKTYKCHSGGWTEVTEGVDTQTVKLIFAVRNNLSDELYDVKQALEKTQKELKELRSDIKADAFIRIRDDNNNL